jgi:hypothetical protein
VAEALARRFHETYERLAPSHGYETREASAKPWADVPSQNKGLMVAVCAEILAATPPPIPTRSPGEGGWRDIATARLGQDGLFWHPLWKRPIVAVRDDDEQGLVGFVYCERTDERFLASCWQPLPAPPEAS